MHANSQWIPHAKDIIYKSVLSLVVSNFGHFKNEYFEEIHVIRFICSIFSLQRETCSPFSTGKVDLCCHVLCLRQGCIMLKVAVVILLFPANGLDLVSQMLASISSADRCVFVKRDCSLVPLG